MVQKKRYVLKRKKTEKTTKHMKQNTNNLKIWIKGSQKFFAISLFEIVLK